MTVGLEFGGTAMQLRGVRRSDDIEIFRRSVGSVTRFKTAAAGRL
jgi:hypothetical protein